MSEQNHWGIVAQFENPAKLTKAAKALTDDGYATLEAWSPFPVHGMEKTMKLGGSKVPWIATIGAFTGFTIAVLLQWWTGAIEYKVVIGGKPLFAFEPSMPVMFELTVLLTCFGNLIGMFVLNGLPRHHHPLDGYEPFRKVTDDGFFLTIETADPKFDAEVCQSRLTELGGQNVAMVEA